MNPLNCTPSSSAMTATSSMVADPTRSSLSATALPNLDSASQAPKTIILAGGFQEIFIDEDYFQPANKKRGCEIVQGGHLHNVREHRMEGQIFVRGECLPEMKIKKQDYRIEFQIDPATRKISDARCSCVAGISAKCKHGAALFQFVNEERSEGKTDESQSWQGPSKRAQSLYPKGETVQKLFGAQERSRPTFKKSKEECASLAKEMEQFGLTHSCLYKSLTVPKGEKEEAPPVNFFPPVCDEICTLFHEELLIPGENLQPGQDEARLFQEKVVCDNPEEVFISTLGQSQNKAWFIQKKYRISASKSHRISRARPENRVKYCIGFQGDHPNLRYGREMEPLAKEKYVQLTGNSLIECGLVVKKCQPWLCASPDAVVKDPEGSLFLLEIKCPSSCKAKCIAVPYLNEEGFLKKNHEYYCQIQISMYCLTVKKCHFFVFSSADFRLLEISRDDSFL